MTIQLSQEKGIRASYGWWGAEGKGVLTSIVQGSEGKWRLTWPSRGGREWSGE